MQAVIILGMHRSGTSCMAGSLEAAGLYLGDVVTEAPFNKKGNRENKAIMALNNAVLRESGGSWRNPPASIRWTAAQEAERDRILGDYPNDRVWGFKDPRTLLLLDGWLAALEDVQLVGTLRHPVATARSLMHRQAHMKRNDFTFDEAVALWSLYNERLRALARNRWFPIIDFDKPADAYRTDLTRLAALLGLERERAGIFFEDALRLKGGIDYSLDGLPPESRALYDELKSICL